jgi:GntR family transcriptional regulator
VSRYERIAAELRERILAGEYAPGERLPRQTELARSWNVNLLTVRQALDQLEQDGLLRVEHGVGTFVADLDRAYDPFAVASFTDVLRERGLEFETRLLSVDARARSAAAAAALRATDGEDLVALTRVRLIEGRPIVCQVSYVAGRLGADMAGYDGAAPLYAFLRDRAGRVAGAYRETITAEATPPTAAEVLGRRAGEPILVSRRTTATAHGEPFLYDEAYLPPDRVRVSVSRQGTRCSVELSPILAALDVTHGRGGAPGDRED